MSFYELDRPAAPTTGLTDRIGGFFTTIRTGVSGTMRSLAMARMMRVLFEMDDETLARIGVTRSQIPAYADQCLSRDRAVKG